RSQLLELRQTVKRQISCQLLMRQKSKLGMMRAQSKRQLLQRRTNVGIGRKKVWRLRATAEQLFKSNHCNNSNHYCQQVLTKRYHSASISLPLMNVDAETVSGRTHSRTSSRSS